MGVVLRSLGLCTNNTNQEINIVVNIGECLEMIRLENPAEWVMHEKHKPQQITRFIYFVIYPFLDVYEFELILFKQKMQNSYTLLLTTVILFVLIFQIFLSTNF
jgi:hypothetical protein